MIMMKCKLPPLLFEDDSQRLYSYDKYVVVDINDRDLILFNERLWSADRASLRSLRTTH